MKSIVLIVCSIFALFPLKANSISSPNPDIVDSLPLSVEYKGSLYGFTESQRLVILLHPFSGTSVTTWSRSVLYRLDSNKQQHIDNLKSEVIKEINLLARINYNNKQLAMLLVELAQYLRSSRFAYPLLYDFDPSEALVNPNKNPKIPSGRYILSTSKFTPVIKFIGLGGIFYQSIEHSKTAWLLFRDSRFPFKNSVDEIWSVEPMQKFKPIKVAYWNRSDYLVSESETFFVPIPLDLLSDKHIDLNSKVVELLSYRIED